LQQAALREWFVDRFNRLVRYCLRWENFKTTDDHLRPQVHEQILITLGRLLATTGHLLASIEPSTRLADFWDLFDLYAAFRGGDHAGLLVPSFWRRIVSPAVGSIPGELGTALVTHANEIYEGWVTECLAGVIQPSRVEADRILIGPPGQLASMTFPNFLARHIVVRRNTLHTYHLRETQEFRDFLAIHDGSLPQRLPEWGRYLFLALISDPSSFLGRYARLPSSQTP